MNFPDDSCTKKMIEHHILCSLNELLLTLLDSRDIPISRTGSSIKITVPVLIMNVIQENDIELINAILKYYCFQPSDGFLVSLIIRFANANTIDYLLNNEEYMRRSSFNNGYYNPFELVMERDDDSVEIISKICYYLKLETDLNNHRLANIIFSGLAASIKCNNIKMFEYVMKFIFKHRNNYLNRYLNVTLTYLYTIENTEIMDAIIKNHYFDTDFVMNSLNNRNASCPHRNRVVRLFMSYEEDGKIRIEHPLWEKMKQYVD
jgi:hypothetical protein